MSCSKGKQTRNLPPDANTILNIFGTFQLSNGMDSVPKTKVFCELHVYVCSCVCHMFVCLSTGPWLFDAIHIDRSGFEEGTAVALKIQVCDCWLQHIASSVTYNADAVFLPLEPYCACKARDCSPSDLSSVVLFLLATGERRVSYLNLNGMISVWYLSKSFITLHHWAHTYIYVCYDVCPWFMRVLSLSR